MAVSDQRHPRVRRILHWLTALVIIFTFIVGMNMTHWPTGTAEEIAATFFAYSLHKSLGTVVFGLTLLRVLSMPFRPIRHKRHSSLENFAASVAHSYLLVALIGLPVTGYLQHAFVSGAAPIWILPGGGWHAESANPDFAEAAGHVHEAIASFGLLIFAAHVLGALKHHFWDRDATLRHMLWAPKGGAFPTAYAEEAPKRTIRTGQAVGVILIVVVGIFGYFGEGHDHDHDHENSKAGIDETQLHAGVGQWQLIAEESWLKIEAMQGGNQFSAQFERFDAAISLDRDDLKNANIAVVIDARSFSSGLTDRDQTVAGPDWLNAEKFPTAHWQSEKVVRLEGNNYRAKGQLTIGPMSLSVPLDFTLEIDDGEAMALGHAEFDRFDIALGQGLTGAESAAGRPIKIKFEIRAEQDDDH